MQTKCGNEGLIDVSTMLAGIGEILSPDYCRSTANRAIVIPRK